MFWLAEWRFEWQFCLHGVLPRGESTSVDKYQDYRKNTPCMGGVPRICPNHGHFPGKMPSGSMLRAWRLVSLNDMRHTLVWIKSGRGPKKAYPVILQGIFLQIIIIYYLAMFL